MGMTLEDEYKEFRTKVRLMREAQNGYFRNRTSLNLQKAKFLEQAVDAMLDKEIGKHE